MNNFVWLTRSAKLRIWRLRIWGFRGPGFRSPRQALCGDASCVFLDQFSKHLSSVLGPTELCHDVRNPGPQKNQNDPQQKPPFGIVRDWLGEGGSPGRVARGQMCMCCARNPRNKNMFVWVPAFLSGYLAGRIGDRGDRGIVCVPNVYVPLLAPKTFEKLFDFLSERFSRRWIPKSQSQFWYPPLRFGSQHRIPKPLFLQVVWLYAAVFGFLLGAFFVPKAPVTKIRVSGQESPRQTKPKKGPQRKVHEFRPFLWILVFSFGKQARFTLNFCSGMPLWKVHELTFLWFGLRGPLLIWASSV